MNKNLIKGSEDMKKEITVACCQCTTPSTHTTTTVTKTKREKVHVQIHPISNLKRTGLKMGKKFINWKYLLALTIVTKIGIHMREDNF